MAFAQRVTVTACILTSLAVAVLWGGNLTAVFPVVDVIMNDQALPDWVDEEIKESDREVADARKWLTQLEELKSDDQKTIQLKIQAEIQERQHEVAQLIQNLAGPLNDVQIAEKTRLSNFIVGLQKLQSAAPDHLALRLANEIEKTQGRLKVYSKRAGRFRWIAPAVHRSMPDTPFKTLLVVCAFVLVCTLVKNAFRVWNSVVSHQLGHMVSHELRKDFYQQMLRLDMANFTEKGCGDLMNRCTSDINHIGQGVHRLFGNALLEPLKAIVCFGIAAWVSWRLLLLTIIIAPVAGYTVHWLGRALKRTHRKAMQELSLIYEALNESLVGIKLIKAFTMETPEQERFDRSAKEYLHRQHRIATYNALVSPIVETLGIAMVLLASVMGGYLVLGQQTHILGIRISDVPLTHGMMSVFFAMLAGMSDPARRLSNEFSHIQQAVACSDRVWEILDRQPKIVDPLNPVVLPPLKHAVRFEGVSFHYHPNKPVLRGVDLEIRAGETIAIVGPNGCGKTSLFNLLPRFYDPSAGRVVLEGVDIRDVTLRDLRSRFGLVSQEVLLFNDTVAANIAYGKANATHEEIESAARKAHAHTFITEKLPNGYKTLVGPSGSRLSGGQRQRISLARAILRDPEILLLDEATSQIDIESEQLIFEVLEQFSRDRTTLMITHRVSMISLADRVVVMDQGRIVDTGTHDELIARCDLYRRLCHFGYRESA
jgi:ATP-binding cassette subfamily B protein/subfamily B ATP-binding cassette protein MsbA